MGKLKLYEKANEYLECEKWWTFTILMFVSGYYGAFTYTLRGGVFCNAQTANFVLFAMELGNGRWMQALYFFIPMTAYFLGAVLSEWAETSIQRIHLIRWDTLLIFLEMVTVVFLGLLPETTPYQISQVLINFICSMQYNTFREAQGIPMATTFCTNHLRQTGVSFCNALRHRDAGHTGRMLCHLAMLAVFVLGGVVSAILCRYFLGKAIWGALLPLGVVLADLLHADLKTERDQLDRTPRGH